MKEQLKSLSKDTMTYGLMIVISRFLTFALSLLYAHDLTTAEMGNLSTVLTLVLFSGILAAFGMEAGFFRFFDKEKPEENRRLFSNAYLTIAITSFFLSLILFLFAEHISELITDNAYGLPMIRYAAWIPFLDSIMLIPYAYLRMVNRTREFTITRFSVTVIAAGLSLLFVIVLKQGPTGALKAQFISSFIGAAVLFRHLIKNKLFKYDFSLYKKMLVFGLPTIPASLSAIILQISDQPLIKFLIGGEEGSSQTGIYSINYKLGIPMMFFVTMFEYAWKPFYLNHRKDENAKDIFARVLTYFTLLASVIFLLISLFIDHIVQIPLSSTRTVIPAEYWQGLSIVPFVLLGYYFNGMFTNFTSAFYITKKTKYLPIAIGVAAIFNFTSNIIFIPIYGYIAAAYNTLLAYMISAGLLYYFQRKIYVVNYEWGRIFKIVFSTGSIYIINYYFNNFENVLTDILFKTFLLCLHVILLRLLGFYSKSEISEIKRIAKR